MAIWESVGTNFRLAGGGYLFAISTTAISAGIGPFDGDMAEVVVAHAPSETDVTQLESYLKTKYGL